MVAIKLPIFAGMVPSIDRHLLADQNAQNALNTWLYSGALDGMPQFSFLHTNVNSAAATAFRIPGNLDDPTYLPNSLWVEFNNPNTDFIKAPISADSYRRFYWASSNGVPMYNTLARLQINAPGFKLGLPQPVTPTATASGGSSTTLVSRAYVATLVTIYGEEGPASTPVLINGKQDDTYNVTVGGVNVNDQNGVDRFVNLIRLYRTVVGASGVTNYYLVATVGSSTGSQTITDTLSDSTLASRNPLESTAWTAPPSDLQGFTVMPNGIIASWRENELWFSEPYRPHAWPVAYSLSLEHKIVGMAVTAQTLVVCTEGHPFAASGVNPASITTSKLGAFEPCLSRGSIVAAEEGVYYTSPNGLILVSSAGAENITRKVISRDKWLELTGNAPVRAGKFGTAYYAFGASLPLAIQDDAFQTNAFQQASVIGAKSGFMIDPQSENSGIVYIDAPSTVTNVRNDEFSGELLVHFGAKSYWLDQSPGYAIRPFVWKSKVFQAPEIKNFAAYKVFFYVPDVWRDRDLGPLNTNINQVFDPNMQMALVRIYADGRLISAHELQVPGELHRLPSGYKADFWEIEITAQVRIKSFQMATSVKELSIV